jgi:CarD family transcriptional regulator
MMYKIGDKIVYPMHGAGIIEKIEEKEILGKTRQYYVLSLSPGDMKVMIPIDKCEEIGVRDIIGEQDIEAVFDVLRAPSTKMSDNWNRRNRENMERLKTGDIQEVAGVVRNLVRVEKDKPLSTGEKRMLSNAKQILISELILTLNKKAEEIEVIIGEMI